MNNYQQKNQHLWWRAGFGPPADQVIDLPKQKPQALFRNLLLASDKKPVFFDVADPDLKEMVMEFNQGNLVKLQALSPDKKQMIRKQSVQDIYKLNLRWLKEMTESPAQLREKMSLFWHGHFASKTLNILYDQDLLNVIRENALGNFRDLLFAVSKSASMIRFLNNNQNKKEHPNENFARELMELFTVGRGHYTETDVKESARAFTGWNANPSGEFEVRTRQHDTGPKTFFGKTGNYSGEDILEILLEQKQTAVFITAKIYRFFVNEKPNEERINDLATRFYSDGYDIQNLLYALFTSTWFYDQENIGSQIKSPIVWLVGIRRQLPMDLQNPGVQIILERLLGQVLFAPPNVAGWPGGKHWIDSSSLMLRMQVPQLIDRGEIISTTPKEDDDLMMGIHEKRFRGNLKKISNPTQALFQGRIFWDSYMKNFSLLPDTELFISIRNLLLQKPVTIEEQEMSKYIDESNRQDRIRSITIRLMSTPEYQLC
jgi:uncharacterized protein (DUF1800 family)